jgi:hypothetical protein
MNGELAPMMSDDGEFVFFTSRDALVAEDVNGAVQDVYQWHQGVRDLISSGRASVDDVLIGPSGSGNDIFFITSERLVGWDTDRNTDVYDARVGGGFPEPLPDAPPCEGAETCHAEGTSSPLVTGAGSAVHRGPGNQAEKTKPRVCPKGKRKVVRKGKARCVARHRKASTARRVGK